LETHAIKRIEQLKQILDAAGAEYAILAHDETVKSAEDGVEKGFGELRVMAPTLILKTETGYLVAIIGGETRLSYKKIKKGLGLKNISLATPAEVLEATSAEVGTVSLVNPGLCTIVDERLPAQEMVYGGCGVPQRTLCIRVADLVAVTRARVFDFTELK
jgi:prolyl-tRNA editing enzyme YbaK/EbsC (Cys-tRNA(Pro) deacylase)